MEYVYLNQDQCKLFETSYFGEANLFVAATALMNSCKNGYDDEHTDFLKSLGGKILSLSREVSDNPGWFRVSN